MVETQIDRKALPTRQKIREELARRKLLNFTNLTFNDAEGNADNDAYQYNWFHELICNQLDKFLEDVANKKSPRLMIYAPPRHGKSELASRRFPAHAIGKYPHFHFITASYNSDLAEAMCKNVQEIMEDSSYRKIFPNVRVKSTLAHVDRSRRLPTQNTAVFDILRKDGKKLGVYNATGVSTGATGKGAHVFIIDDPVKDAKEASSATYRENVDQWFKSVAYTRLAPGGGILLIMTRWHDDDLGGRLLKEMEKGEGDKWKIINCKAIAEQDELYRKRGEALHPARYDIDRLMKIKNAVGQRIFNSLYQQHPTNKEGGLFKKSYFEMVDEIPRKLRKRVRYWDRAGTLPHKGNPDPDYTVGIKLVEDYKGIIYVADMVRERNTPLKIDTIIKNTATQDSKKTKIGFSEDPGQAGKQQTEFHKKLLKGYILKFRRETGSKEIRAEASAVDAELGKIKVLRAPWNKAFFEEITGFPYMAHDDIVDSLAGAHYLITGGKYDLRKLVEGM